MLNYIKKRKITEEKSVIKSIENYWQELNGQNTLRLTARVSLRLQAEPWNPCWIIRITCRQHLWSVVKFWERMSRGLSVLSVLLQTELREVRLNKGIYNRTWLSTDLSSKSWKKHLLTDVNTYDVLHAATRKIFF
jgi:hypothetical protein